jgi:hypothetical protein
MASAVREIDASSGLEAHLPLGPPGAFDVSFACARIHVVRRISAFCPSQRKETLALRARLLAGANTMRDGPIRGLWSLLCFLRQEPQDVLQPLAMAMASINGFMVRADDKPVGVRADVRRGGGDRQGVRG